MTSFLRLTTVSYRTGKTRVGYFKAGWTDNNIPRSTSKKRTLALRTDMAETMAANLNRRIADNGGAIHVSGSTSMIRAEVVPAEGGR